MAIRALCCATLLLLLQAVLAHTDVLILDSEDAESVSGMPCAASEDGFYCVSDCDTRTPTCATQCAAGNGAKGGEDETRQNCQNCTMAAPYADHGARVCVEACPAGFVPNADKDCTECGQDLFADHATKECVGTCGTGFAGNATSNDCEKCVGATPYADHTAHTCVAECPSGSVGSLTTSDDEQFGSCDACADGEFADHNQHKCVAAETDCPAGSNPRDSTHNCDHSCTAAANGNSLYWDDSDDPASEDAVPPKIGCVSKCPTGHAPQGTYKVCTQCSAATFADHEAHACVETCPDGYTGDADTKECVQDE